MRELRICGQGISISAGTLCRPTLTGHEPVEIWSNQFRKWIWIDGTSAYYAEDSGARVPLSLWEVRQRQLRFCPARPWNHRIVNIAGVIHRGAGWMLTCRCGTAAHSEEQFPGAEVALAAQQWQRGLDLERIRGLD